MDVETASLQSFRDLDSLYLSLLSDIKSEGPIWDDVISKGGKLFAALRMTVHASNAFLDAIQRLADLASKTSGGSKEIGAHFTRLCMRQKRLGSKVKTMGNQLITCVVNPVTSHMEEWKKSIAQIEKEHNRETKRARGEFKRALSEANRLKRKLAKHGNVGTLHSRQNSGNGTIGQGVGLGEPPTSIRVLPPNASCGIGNSSLAVRTESAVKILEEKIRHMEDLERATIKRLMLEERGRYCFFFNCLQPVLETETSLLGEISTLRELLTALTTATEDPSRLLEEAELVLARAGVATGEARISVTPSGALHSPSTNKVEAFASAVDAIMSSRRQRLQQQQQQEATLSFVSDSMDSTSSGWSGSGVGSRTVTENEPCASPISSQVSFHSANSGPIGQQNQIPAIIRQSRVPQNDIGPRSASVGRPVANGTPQCIISTGGVEDAILRRPTNNGIRVISAPSRRPQTTTIEAREFSGLPSVSAVTPEQPSPNQRHSTCTLQELNDTVIPACSLGSKETSLNNTVNDQRQDEEEEEETASGTLDEETSDDGVLLGGRRYSNVGSKNFGEEMRRPVLSNLLSCENRSLSRGGELNKLLYPDQSLPPPVYTNLNKLTHAAQRKFSMSTTVTPNTPTGGPPGDPMTWHQPVLREGDNLSIASAPHGQPEPAATNGGVYSMPGSPHRPSFSTSSTNSRPRGSSVGIEDPFSMEMDELDRMVTGSSAASSVTSRSGRSGNDSVSHQHHTRPINNSTGVPVGLLRASKSPDANALRRSRSRSSSLARLAIPDDPEARGVPIASFNTQCIPDLEHLNHWQPKSISVQPATSPGADVENHANRVSFAAASLLTQLSGQLQQITYSNATSVQKQPRPCSGNSGHAQNESAEFDLPAPPSPDMLDVR